MPSLGGAIRLNGFIDATIHGCRFTDNFAGDQGGVLYLTGTVLLSITESTFLRNEAATTDGGVIHSIGVSEITVNGVEMKNNRAGGSGGAIWSNTLDAAIRIDNSTISHNTATSGGAYSGRGSLYIGLNSRVWITHNQAVGNYGAIFIVNTRTRLELDQVDIEFNSYVMVDCGLLRMF